MKIALCSDHGGLHLKNAIIDDLIKSGHEIKDFGTTDESSCDYPDFALRAADAIRKGEYERGIFVCTTGIGISMAANKVPTIRCALCHDTVSARLTREHNDANVLALGEGVTGKLLALEIVKVFLETPFSNNVRHQRRIDKITEIEKQFMK